MIVYRDCVVSVESADTIYDQEEDIYNHSDDEADIFPEFHGVKTVPTPGIPSLPPLVVETDPVSFQFVFESDMEELIFLSFRRLGDSEAKAMIF